VPLQQRRPTASWAAVGSPRQTNGGDPSSLLSTDEATSGVLGLSLGSLQYKENMDICDRVQQLATKMAKGLENQIHKDRLRDLSLFSLDTRRLRGILAICINSRRRWKQTLLSGIQ